MARGWESKDVEAQTEEAQELKAPSDKTTKSVDQMQKDRDKQGLELSRKRILNELEVATHPNHRKSLEAALAHLDQKLNESK
ncbi:MAG TPA: hypothetical protein VLX32_05135 [Candidatus Acidoferrum sp.]|nr:hypothetical protein [Candidatus Acidoferrum sp.]